MNIFMFAEASPWPLAEGACTGMLTREELLTDRLRATANAAPNRRRPRIRRRPPYVALLRVTQVVRRRAGDVLTEFMMDGRGWMVARY